MSYLFDVDPRGPGGNWVRTDDGWRHMIDGHLTELATFALSNEERKNDANSVSGNLGNVSFALHTIHITNM